MKKKLSGIVLATSLLCTGTYADDLHFKDGTKSLIAFETGFSSLDMDLPTVSGESESFANVGVKVGAETRNYRVFASFRYLAISDFDYATTVGLELQYLINLSSSFNMFVGLNGGYANMKLADSSNRTRTFSDPYYGADFGCNYHMNENFDLEVGVRVNTLDAENTLDAAGTYKLNNILGAYVGVVYKFDLDK